MSLSTNSSAESPDLDLVLSRESTNGSAEYSRSKQARHVWDITHTARQPGIGTRGSSVLPAVVVAVVLSNSSSSSSSSSSGRTVLDSRYIPLQPAAVTSKTKKHIKIASFRSSELCTCERVFIIFLVFLVASLLGKEKKALSKRFVCLPQKEKEAKTEYQLIIV